MLIGAPNETTGGLDLGYVIRGDGRRLSSKTNWAEVASPATAGLTYGYWGFAFAS